MRKRARVRLARPVIMMMLVHRCSIVGRLITLMHELSNMLDHGWTKGKARAEG